ncbi:hypothetical protein [Pseudomonas pergaminensis]
MLSSTFHDGKLVSIDVADDILAIEISTQEKTTKIQVSGLQKLRINEFKEGNIINIARIVHAEKSAESEITGRSLLKYVYELDDTNLMQNSKFSSFLDKKAKEFEEGSIVILEIEPSYGAYLVAVGRDILEEDIT